MGHTGAVHPTIVIYSRAARITALTVGSIAAGLFGWTVYKDGLLACLPYLPYVMAVALSAWILWGQPRLQIDEDGLHARNMFTRCHVPWEAIESVRADFGLVVDTTSGPIRFAAAAPRSGFRTQGRNPAPAPLPHIDRQATRVTLDLDSNQALRLIEQVREERQDELTFTSPHAGASSAVVRSRLDRAVLLTSTALAVWIITTWF